MKLLSKIGSITLHRGVDYTAAAGDLMRFIKDGNGTISIEIYKKDGAALVVPSTALLLRGYIDGLIMSTAGGSATMTIAAGQATDSTNAVMMSLASSIAKTTSAWAVGTGNGGKLSAAAIANSTWYYFFLIRRPDTGVVDVGFDVSATTPTMPTDYTQYRYIGAGLTDGLAQWTRFVQNGNYYEWYNPPLDVDATTNTTAALSTLTVPRGPKS